MSTSDKITTQCLELVDGAGKVRAVLGVSPDGSIPGITLNGSAGKPGTDAAYFALYDTTHRPRAALMITADTPCLVLLDSAGKARVKLGFGQDVSSLSLCDQAGQARATLSFHWDESTLTLCDQTGKVRASLSFGFLDTWNIVFYDKAGKASYMGREKRRRAWWWSWCWWWSASPGD